MTKIDIDDKVVELVNLIADNGRSVIVGYTDNDGGLSMTMTVTDKLPFSFHLSALVLGAGNNIDQFFIKMLQYIKDENIDYSKSLFITKLMDEKVKKPKVVIVISEEEQERMDYAKSVITLHGYKISKLRDSYKERLCYVCKKKVDQGDKVVRWGIIRTTYDELDYLCKECDQKLKATGETY